MKKFSLLLLSIFLGLFLLNLSVRPTQADSLTMGVLANDRPYSMRKNGTLQGFSIDLAQKLTNKAKIPILIKTYSSQKKLTVALKEGKVAFILGDKANFSATFSHTKAILHPKNVLFTRADSSTRSVEKLTGKKVGLLQAGQQTALLKQLGFKPVSFSTTTALMKSLASGKISAAILSDYTYQAYLKKHPEMITTTAKAAQTSNLPNLHQINDPSITAQSLSLITYKQPKVQKRLQTAISSLRNSGQLTKLSQKYFGQDLTLE